MIAYYLLFLTFSYKKFKDVISINSFYRMTGNFYSSKFNYKFAFILV